MIISIAVPEVDIDVDLYTDIMNQIDTPVQITSEVFV